MSKSLTEVLRDAWSDNLNYGGLDKVMEAIASGARKVHKRIELAALSGILGDTGRINLHGESVQEADIIASDIFVESLRESGKVAVVGCEEIEEAVVLGNQADKKYMVLMDPMDGSSNVDVAISVGSIFGIWPRNREASEKDMFLLAPGVEQVAAVYVIYGSSTVLVMADHSSVQGFTLDPMTGEFLLTHPDIRIPDDCPYYSVNEGNFKKWDGMMQKNVKRLRDMHSHRYVGSLVADFHRNLLKGGIFLYPGDSKNPSGKLRLMYEANPLSFIAEKAGGKATSGSQRILEIQPRMLHERTPLFIGNAVEIEEYF